MTLTQIKPAGLSKPVDLADNEKIRLGTGNDLEIYHDGSNSRIKDTGQGNLIVNASRFDVVNVADNEYIATFAQDGAVELYHNGSKKFQTNGAGVDVFQNLYLGDNVNLKFGTGADLQIFHNGTHSRFINSTGNLEIAGSQIDFTDVTLSQYAARFDTNDSVDLYFNGSKKLETTSWGASVTGTLIASSNIKTASDTGKLMVGAGDDLQIYHDGTTSRLHSVSKPLIIKTIDGYDLSLQTNSENAVVCKGNAAVELYHNNVKKFETTSAGTLTTGALVTDLDGGTAGKGQLAFGQSGRPFIEGYDSGNHGSGAVLNFRSGAGDYMARMKFDNAVDLYYDNARKLSTTSTGIEIPGNCAIELDNGSWTGEHEGKIQHHANYLYIQGGSNGVFIRSSGGNNRWIFDGDGHFSPNANNSYDIGSTSQRVRNIYTNDLHLSNEGHSNEIDGSWGNWTIQEGESDLFLKNNRSGKKYKFNLTEVS